MAKKTFKIRSNLAEALEDTISSANNNAGELHIEIIPLRKIELDPDNPRELLLSLKDVQTKISGNAVDIAKKKKEKDSLESMIGSIKAQGVINPIIVYKAGEQYKLVAGERRTLSSILAGKTDIPAKILTQKPAPLKLSMLQWIENMERAGLTLWERLKNLEKITLAFAMENNIPSIKVKATDIQKVVGCKEVQAINYKNLIRASDCLKLKIKSGEITSIDKASFISKSGPEHEMQLIEACINGNTLAEMRKIVKNNTSQVVTNYKKQVIQDKINLGSTQNTKVARLIIDSILQNQSLSKHTEFLSNIEWTDKKSIASAFRQLLKNLETA